MWFAGAYDQNSSNKTIGIIKKIVFQKSSYVEITICKM